jgi:hypothetical protein
MSNKRNLVLYVDSELVKKTHEYGFNLSKTFENHLKTLISIYETGFSYKNNLDTNMVFGNPGETHQ